MLVQSGNTFCVQRHRAPSRIDTAACCPADLVGADKTGDPDAEQRRLTAYSVFAGVNAALLFGADEQAPVDRPLTEQEILVRPTQLLYLRIAACSVRKEAVDCTKLVFQCAVCPG